jgi:dTDP-4-dehydrorhamnose reductase
MFLIAGGDSEIGSATVRRAAERGLPVLATTRRRQTVTAGRLFLDLNDLGEPWQPPRGVTAACLCMAAARLAQCANDPEGSAHINVRQTLRFARLLADAGIYVLLLSTNQVFDGRKPHVAADTPLSPVSAYGKQKAEAEQALREMMAEGAGVGTLRFSKVVSPGMPLLANWREELSRGRPVRAFSDMTMAPVPVSQAADAILHMLGTRAVRIAQLSSPHDLRYTDIARLVAADLGASPSLVIEASARDHGQPEGATPEHTTLDSSYLRETADIAVASPHTVVRNIIRV